MASSKHTPELPSLPAGSIDFDKLSEACRQGKSADEAIAAATQTPEPAPAPETEIQE